MWTSVQLKSFWKQLIAIPTRQKCSGDSHKPDSLPASNSIQQYLRLLIYFAKLAVGVQLGLRTEDWIEQLLENAPQSLAMCQLPRLMDTIQDYNFRSSQYICSFGQQMHLVQRIKAAPLLCGEFCQNLFFPLIPKSWNLKLPTINISTWSFICCSPKIACLSSLSTLPVITHTLCTVLENGPAQYSSSSIGTFLSPSLPCTFLTELWSWLLPAAPLNGLLDCRNDYQGMAEDQDYRDKSREDRKQRC